MIASGTAGWFVVAAGVQWLNVVAGRRRTRALMEEDGGETVAALLQLRGGANGG